MNVERSSCTYVRKIFRTRTTHHFVPILASPSPDHQLHVEYTIALEGHAFPMEELCFLQIPDPLDDVYLAVKVLDEGGLVEEASDELLERDGPIIIVLFTILIRLLILA